jgi:hypothetical protein
VTLTIHGAAQQATQGAASNDPHQLFDLAKAGDAVALAQLFKRQDIQPHIVDGTLIPVSLFRSIPLCVCMCACVCVCIYIYIYIYIYTYIYTYIHTHMYQQRKMNIVPVTSTFERPRKPVKADVHIAAHATRGQQTEIGSTALHYAAAGGHTQAVEQLLLACAPPDKVSAGQPDTLIQTKQSNMMHALQPWAFVPITKIVCKHTIHVAALCHASYDSHSHGISSVRVHRLV